MLIVANWKMNKDLKESVSFAEKFNSYLDELHCDTAICAPFTSIHSLREALDERAAVGAQNMYFEDKGAFTGEVSPVMLKDCYFVILGHSERRQIFREDNSLINKKVKAAIKHGLMPILCVGETLEEREAGETESVVEKQVRECLNGVSDRVVIAYEPVWAIGSGRNASPEQAEEVHRFIRGLREAKIIYGGSVNPENSKAILSQRNIDGALVGGASLDVESFVKICKNA